MNLKAIILDLDGTLLTSQGIISNKTFESLTNYHHQDIKLIIATGRTKQTIPKIVSTLPIDYYITSNGAVIYDYNNQIIYQKNINNDVLNKLLTVINNKNYALQYYVEGKVYINNYLKEHVEDYEIIDANKKNMKIYANVLINIESFIINKNCEKINLFFNKPYTNEKEKSLKNKLAAIDTIKVVSGGIKNIEITNYGVSKASALDYLFKLINIDKKDAVSFGDSENDLDLIKHVGYGIAMANSAENVKANAYFITKSNDEDGIYFALKKLGDRFNE